jgi:predicted metalloprotease with PDZ domain
MNIKVRQIASLIFTVTALYGGEPVPVALSIGLTSEDFAKRESSQAALLAWARGLKQGGVQILKLSQVSDDPEVQKRSAEILRQLSDEDYLSDGQGYLGITMLEEKLDGKQQSGIRILNLVKGSPAEQAGLEEGDLIIALDGKTWDEIGAVTLFGDAIGKKKPLVEVDLTVKRAEENPVEIRVKLGRRPIDDLREARESLELLDVKSRERHFRNWLKAQEEAAK